jgi:hypothetical protein
MSSASLRTLPLHLLRLNLARDIRLALNSAFLLLNAAHLPRVCAPAALPHASDLSAPYQAPLVFTSVKHTRSVTYDA